MREKYESLSLTVLRDLAKARNMKHISSMRKAELIEAMLAQDEEDRKNEEAAKSAAKAASETAAARAAAEETAAADDETRPAGERGRLRQGSNARRAGQNQNHRENKRECMFPFHNGASLIDPPTDGVAVPCRPGNI